eukprot:4038104-Alexandrium_andersonii.AAC.1
MARSQVQQGSAQSQRNVRGRGSVAECSGLESSRRRPACLFRNAGNRARLKGQRLRVSSRLR